MAALNQRTHQVLSLRLPDLAAFLEPDNAELFDPRSTGALPDNRR